MADVPSVPKYVQVEETEFRSPTSESMIQKIAGTLNYILDNMDWFAPGSVIPSQMSLAQFQAVMGTGWVLADGSAAPLGSKYITASTYTVLPDLRGVYARGFNNGKATGYYDPDTRSLNPGAGASYQDDRLARHGHFVNWNNTTNNNFASLRQNVGDAGYPHINMDGGSEHPSSETTPYPHPPTIGNTGDLETTPGYVTINWFVRVN